MPNKYIIDTSSLVSAYRRIYSMNVFKSFWEEMKNRIMSGEIIICQSVYEEIAVSDDNLKAWLKSVVDLPHLVLPVSEKVFSIYTKIVNHVNTNYTHIKPSGISKFMSCQDPMIVAFAKEYNYFLITEETLNLETKKEVKMPNICRDFGVSYLSLTEYLDKEKWSL